MALLTDLVSSSFSGSCTSTALFQGVGHSAGPRQSRSELPSVSPRLSSSLPAVRLRVTTHLALLHVHWSVCFDCDLHLDPQCYWLGCCSALLALFTILVCANHIFFTCCVSMHGRCLVLPCLNEFSCVLLSSFALSRQTS